MSLFDRLLRKKDLNSNNGMLLFFDFINIVPYPKYRHSVVSVASLPESFGFCKQFSFWRLLSEDEKFIVAMEIRLFEIISDKYLKKAVTYLITIIESAFKDIGIEAKINLSKTYRFSQSYESYIHDIVSSPPDSTIESADTK